MEENDKSGVLYHERQVKELCALHALNNLFQKKQAFTKKELDDICNRLSPDAFINPHRSVLGMGNYDVNVLMAALQEKGYETVWFDKRKDVDVLAMENIMGLILNTPSEYRLGFIKLPIHRKHWIAIRYLQGQYMNLDSKMDSPKPIGDLSSLLTFLQGELSDGDKELLLVVEPSVSEKCLWKKESIDSSSNHVVTSGATRTDADGPNDLKTTNRNVEADGKEIERAVENGLQNMGIQVVSESKVCDKQHHLSNQDPVEITQSMNATS